MFHCWILLFLKTNWTWMEFFLYIFVIFLLKELLYIYIYLCVCVCVCVWGIFIRFWVWRRGSSRKMMDVEKKHTSNGDLKFAKVIGLGRELTKWNYIIRKWWTTCASRRDVVFHTKLVIYNVMHAKNKKTTYKVQDVFSNKFGTIISIY